MNGLGIGNGGSEGQGLRPWTPLGPGAPDPHSWVWSEEGACRALATIAMAPSSDQTRANEVQGIIPWWGSRGQSPLAFPSVAHPLRSTARMTGVAVRNLHKSYGALKVLQDISLEVAEGEFGCRHLGLQRKSADLLEWFFVASAKLSHFRQKDVALVVEDGLDRAGIGCSELAGWIKRGQNELERR